MTDIIYCADNEKYGQIAKEYIEVGTQLPNKVYFNDIYFADQNWKKPNREEYLSLLKIHKPHLATVLDWERWDQRSEVLEWAEEASAFADVVIIIPKCSRSIAYLTDNGMKTINGKEVRLGYSVPTSHGGTDLFVGEFVGWPVHALGGSPKNQLELARYLDVQSADGNYIHQKIKHGQYFDGQRWIQLAKGGYTVQGKDIPETILRLSFPNYVTAWDNLYQRRVWSIK